MAINKEVAVKITVTLGPMTEELTLVLLGST